MKNLAMKKIGSIYGRWKNQRIICPVMLDFQKAIKTNSITLTWTGIRKPFPIAVAAPCIGISKNCEG